MKPFLIDLNQTYLYQDLLSDIKSSTAYYPLFKWDKLYDYFLNMVVAFVTGNDIVLVDNEIHYSELSLSDEYCLNQTVPVKQIKVNQISELIELIQKSPSVITLFTSGTTGQPKKVQHSVETLIREVRTSEKFRDNIWGFTFNPTHMAGLQVFFQAFFNENSLVNLFNVSRSRVYERIQEFKITHISATPTFYRLLLPFANSYLFVKNISFGGEKSDKILIENMSKIFPNAKINNIYASTEAGSLFSSKGDVFQIPQHFIEKIKVEEDELLIHKSLLGKSEGLILRDDYYFTGDLIQWENIQLGTFRFKGRKNELINVGGYKVNPLEIESVILEIPDVNQVIVYGRQNSILGNILVSDVILKSDSMLTEMDIRNYLIGKLQDYKIPRKIRFVDALDITRTGKIKRR